MSRRYHKVQKLSPIAQTTILNEVGNFAERLEDTVLKPILQKTLFKKFVGTDPNPYLKVNAHRKFLETEVTCRATNRKIISALHRNDSYADCRVLHMASRKIAEILGPFSIEDMLSEGRFGPGSTFSCRGNDVSRARKFSLTDVTPEFNKLARGLLAEYPGWAASLVDTEPFARVCPLLDVVPGARYTTVPKDSSTDRSIMVEPTINSWFQQGIGRAIRKRLKRKTGVDLDDQSINQRLALLGSLTDDLATVDLSNASDLISRQLVEDLLPSDWFFWLNLTRSHSVLINGEWQRLEKFSSMGNGFTFDLESLIFYALAHAVTVLEGYNPFWVNVFGDDIIIPSGVFGKLNEVFNDVGFLINVSKSFVAGPFRESCGRDYHLGRNVRGVYIRRLNTDIDLMKLHNRMYEWADRHALNWRDLREVFLSYLAGIKARVPPSLGDVGIFSSFDEARPAYSRDGWEAFRYTTLLPVLPNRERSDRFLMPDRLQGSEFQRNTIALRQDPVAYRYGETWHSHVA